MFRTLVKKVFFKLLLQSTKVKRINQFYIQHQHDDADTFINAVFTRSNLRFTFNTNELQRFPKSGACIVICNHPFGGIDGLILYKILSTLRNDIKIMASYTLRKIQPLKDIILPIDTLDENVPKVYRIKGTKTAFQHLQDGGCLILFPAGEIASYQKHINIITDPRWQQPLIKFIQIANVPVYPAFITETKQPWYINFLKHFSYMSENQYLSQELFFRNNLHINCRIGKEIKPDTIQSFTSVSQLGRFLRVKTYALGSPLDVNQFFPSLKEAEPIAPSIDRAIIENEVNTLGKEHFLFKVNNYKVFCAPAVVIPSVLNEIGRLREITFRQVKEGTNKSIDLDEFDLYYHHLFIWDEEAKCIVGAYRIGKGKEIMAQFGIKGFYIQTLFLY